MDLKNLAEEYKKISQVLDALQVGMEECISVPTNKNILENDLIERRDKPPIDYSVGNQWRVVDPVQRGEYIFKQGINSINEVELNDILCKPLSKNNLKDKSRPSSTEKKHCQTDDKERRFLSKGIAETNITAVTTEKRDVPKLVEASLCKLREHVDILLLSNDTSTVDNDTITENDETIIDDDEVFWEPYNFYEMSLKEIINPSEQSMFDKDVQDINKEMKRLSTLSSTDDMDLTKHGQTIVHQSIINECRNMRTVERNVNSTADDYIGNVIDALSITIKKDVFNKDIQSINEELKRISGSSDTLDVDSIVNTTTPLYQSIPDSNIIAVSPLLLKGTQTEMKTSNMLSHDKTNNLATNTTGHMKINNIANDIQRDIKNIANYKTTDNKQDNKSIVITSPVNQCQNEIGSKNIKNTHINSIKEESKRRGNRIRYLCLDDMCLNTKRPEQINRHLSSPNIKSKIELEKMMNELLVEDLPNKQFCLPGEDEVKQLLSQLETSPPSETICGILKISPKGGSSNNNITVVDNETNDCIELRGSGIITKEILQRAIKENTNPTILDKYNLYQTSTEDDVTSSESDGYQSSVIDSSFDDKDVNIDSSLEDIIGQLLTIGGTINKPFGTPEYFTGSDSMYVEIPKICIKLDGKNKSDNKLQEAYLPNKKSRARKPKITLELSSSGLLPEDDDIHSYLSSITTKDFKRPKNVISIKMATSSSIPEDDESNYVSYEEFKRKSFGIT